MIGVLALQGAFQKHIDCLNILRVKSTLVKTIEDLQKCDGLILPGGESTAHHRLINDKFWLELQEFVVKKPTFGTCCGLILLSKKITNHSDFKTFQALDIEVERNAYGTQVDSFFGTVDACLDGEKKCIKGCFIRAPKIKQVGDFVEVLAIHNNYPVIVRQNNVLACSFHPEVLDETLLHKYFVSNFFDQSLLA